MYCVYNFVLYVYSILMREWCMWDMSCKLNNLSIIELASNSYSLHRRRRRRRKWIWCDENKTEANLASIKSWLLDAFELFMLNVSCNSHCFLALCCALHRITSRVIHRTEWFIIILYIFIHDSCILNDKQQWFVEVIEKCCWNDK